VELTSSKGGSDQAEKLGGDEEIQKNGAKKEKGRTAGHLKNANEKKHEKLTAR